MRIVFCLCFAATISISCGQQSPGATNAAQGNTISARKPLTKDATNAVNEKLPPPPAHYFNDYANIVSPATASKLNGQLSKFDQSTSNQVVVAIFTKMESDSPIAEYTLRVANHWKVGQKDKNNGAALFVFMQDHKLYLQIGYGLEGRLPNKRCKEIIDNDITPHFKRGDFDGGRASGVNAILTAIESACTPTALSWSRSFRQAKDL